MSHDLIQRIEQRTRLAGHNRLGLLLFRVGNQSLFAVNVFKVQEVSRALPLFHIPGLPPAFEGVCDYRGERTVPVIDLNKKLVQPDEVPAAPEFIIVTEFNQSVQGFLVNSVERIINVAVEDLLPPPELGHGRASLITAVTRYQGQFIQVLDLESILAEAVGLEYMTKSLELTQGLPPGNYPRKILVVDDSRVARNQIKLVLDGMGIESVLLSDGLQALEHLKQHGAQHNINDEYLMLISDIEMPVMDGYTLTTEIRKTPQLKHLHILLHTSLSGVFNHAMVQKVGANEFVPKYSSHGLAEKILEHIAHIC